MPAFGLVSADGLFNEHAQVTFNISGSPVAADVNKAMALDTAADTTAKLAGDGERIIGRLHSLEDRTSIEGVTVGTIGMAGGHAFQIAAGLAGAEVVARGKFLCGNGSGLVRAIDPTVDITLPLEWLVVELKTINSVNYAVAVKM